MNAQVMNGSQELPSQQVDDLLYIAVHLQPMALHTVWLEKIECHNKHSYEINGEIKIFLTQSIHIATKLSRKKTFANCLSNY